MFEQLPEPQKPTLTSDQKYLRAHHFAIVINFFVLGYNILHKILMPLYINWTAKVPSLSVHHLDWWWAYHLGLYLLLRRQKWDDWILRAAVCFGFGGVFLQIYMSFNEFSWRMVSFWFTAAATIGVITYILTQSRFKAASLKNAFALFFVFFILGNVVQFALMEFKTDIIPQVDDSAKNKVKVPIEKLLVDPSECGMSGFSIQFEDLKLTIPEPQLIHDFVLHPCGLPVALGYIDRSKGLLLKNSTTQYLNLKLNYLSEGQWRPFHNVPLRPHLESYINFADVPHTMIMIYSDAHPEMGITILIESSPGLVDIVKDHLKIINFPNTGKLTINRSGIYVE